MTESNRTEKISCHTLRYTVPTEELYTTGISEAVRDKLFEFIKIVVK